MKSRLAVTDAIYLQPLIFGLDKEDSPFELVRDYPAKNALKLSERSEEIRNAFLSPIDYARHGGEYCIVPDICVASSNRTGTIQLVIKSDKRNIERISIDVRFTSEIILASIILKEKFKNLPAHQNLQFIATEPNLEKMLSKADAALLVNEFPGKHEHEGLFTLDLVEEWRDLTDLPYVHGFWVGREGELFPEEAKSLLSAKKEGVALKKQIFEAVAQKQNLSMANLDDYISSFSYDFGEEEESSLSEFIHYAYYHGIIGDVPDIQFFDVEPENPAKN